MSFESRKKEALPLNPDAALHANDDNNLYEMHRSAILTLMAS